MGVFLCSFRTFTWMNIIYNLIAHISYFLLQIYSLVNKKMRLFVSGRKETFKKLSVLKPTDKVFWFHAASLGEFEQARPLIEQIKSTYKEHKIVVTFFSPSGYEIRKNYDLADVVCYLPFDTKGKMRRFVKQIHPDFAIIVKYEFWPNLLGELKRNNVRTILVSGIFRKNQMFFKPYGSWMRKSLQAFQHFFVQNYLSKDLLKKVKVQNVTVSGDTRFDRVTKILEQDNSLDFIEEFKQGNYTIVAGSTWEEDEEKLVNYINNSNDEKFIIAPHNIKQQNILKLKKSIHRKTVLYSEKENANLKEATVLIIDTIGLLTKIYASADVAYIGGGFKTGLHNILEPATFGIPIVIGPEYDKFQEAIDLVSLKGCFSIGSQNQFNSIFQLLKEGKEFRETAGKVNGNYVKEKVGATKTIMNYINKQL